MKIIDHNKTAIIWDDRQISYAELIKNIRLFEGLYHAEPGERIGIFSENSPEWIYAFFSAWGRRCIAIPLDAGLPAEDISFILEDCKPSVIFCSSQTRSVLERALSPIGSYSPHVIVFEGISFSESEPVDQIEEADHDEVAVIIYTSGTTGKPKGVMLTYNNLLTSINGIRKLEMITAEDRLLGILPFHHIFPLQGTIIAPLFTGSTSIMVKSLVAAEIMATMQKYKPTMFLGVPRLYEMFHGGLMTKVNAGIVGKVLFQFSRSVGSLAFSRILFAKVQRAFGGSVRAYLTGGAKMDEKVARNLRALGFKLVEGYGLSETAPLVAFNPFDAVRPGSVGFVMDGVEVKIIDGEVAVKGPNVMKGYYNRPVETSEKIRDGWFFTGDRGEFDDDGYLYITGRCDEMIVLPSGKNIDPEEIEKRILGLSPIISEIGILQQNGRLVALVLPDFNVLRHEKIVNFVEKIREMVAEKYNATAAGFKRISQITFIREPLPKTRLGKLKRYLMRGIAENREPSGPTETPSFKEYSIVASYIEKLTDRKVYAGDDFFLDAGMDSLDMLQLSVFIENTFGIPPADIDYGRFPTVLGLSEFIRERKTRIDQTEIDWKRILGQEITGTVETGRALNSLKIIMTTLFSLYHRLQVTGIENIQEGSCIFAANHQSLLDVFMLMRALPHRILSKTFFLAKDKSFYHNRFARLLIKRSNIIMMDVSGDLKNVLLRIAAVIRSGCNVVIFPEGSRTRTGEIGEFKKTFSIISRELGTPIVPVAIDGPYEIMPYGSRFPLPGKISLKFLKQVHPDRDDYAKIAGEVKRMIQRELESKKGGIT
jgi:long-chain acyl-CoA synthetase